MELKIMKNTVKLIVLLSFVIASNVQAETTFLEGSRDAVTIHPSCRDENTGMTAIGVVLPNGPQIKVTIEREDGEDEETIIMSLPYPEFLISTDRRGNVFNGNPIMGARPSLNQSAIFGADTISATVPTYGSRDTTEDTRLAFWKLKGINVYDKESNTLKTLSYVPNGEFITVELGFALPKFAPESCLMSLNVRGGQMARCEQVDSSSQTILANSEVDIRKKRMRLTAERDLENNPLPAHCGEGLNVTVEPTDEEVADLEVRMLAMTP